MKTTNPLISRLVQKASKPRNHVLLALKQRQSGAGAHVKWRSALRRAEHMALQRALDERDA
ncbi:MAG: hypothetical protein JNJ55_08500 [Betaproteobacteria bacterium]|nr:hypothetical protein [Betaproteobacteria bacterium]